MRKRRYIGGKADCFEKSENVHGPCRGLEKHRGMLWEAYTRGPDTSPCQTVSGATDEMAATDAIHRAVLDDSSIGCSGLPESRMRTPFGEQAVNAAILRASVIISGK